MSKITSFKSDDKAKEEDYNKFVNSLTDINNGTNESTIGTSERI